MREDHFFCGAGQGAKLKIRKTGRTEPKNQQKCIIWRGGASIPDCDDDYHKDPDDEDIGRIQSHEQPLEDMYCNDFDDCCYADK